MWSARPMRSANTAVEVVHPIKDLHVTLLHLLGLDDNKLTYFHGGRFKQLSQDRRPGNQGTALDLTARAAPLPQPNASAFFRMRYRPALAPAPSRPVPLDILRAAPSSSKCVLHPRLRGAETQKFGSILLRSSNRRFARCVA